MAQYAADTEQAHAASTPTQSDSLALSTFATTTVILGCIFADFIAPSMSTSISFFAAVAFFGGLVQFILGMRSGTSLYIAYGGFLMTLGAIFAPSLGIAGSASPALLGLFFLTWTIFSGMLLLSTLKASLSTIVTNLLLFLAYLLLTIGELTGSTAISFGIGGWLAIVCGLVAWYTALTGMLSADNSMFKLPAW